LHARNGREFYLFKKNISRGRYVLSVAVHGFGDWISPSLEITEGQRVDLGRIVLEPCGRLILAVKDREGKIIQDFALYRGDVKL